MKKLLSLTLLSLPLLVSAEKIDFDQVRYWVGEGENRAALLVQFDLPKDENPGTIIWGYRWGNDETPTTASMIKQIAKESNDLILLEQYTGNMGYTLDGIGFGASASVMLQNIYFDYDSACADGNLSFGYITPNTGMGQTHAPGQEAINLSYDAIADAETTHVIEHPLNYEVYGYPAYDYDHWKMNDIPDAIWQAGWYNGYWSFWVGSADQDIDNLQYSGMGMSSIEVHDGDVSGWKYQALTGGGGFGEANDTWLPLNYTHTLSVITGIDRIVASNPFVQIYNLNGTMIYSGNERPTLPAGIYILRHQNKTEKIFIK